MLSTCLCAGRLGPHPSPFSLFGNGTRLWPMEAEGNRKKLSRARAHTHTQNQRELWNGTEGSFYLIKMTDRATWDSAVQSCSSKNSCCAVLRRLRVELLFFLACGHRLAGCYSFCSMTELDLQQNCSSLIAPVPEPHRAPGHLPK